mmetsp:Transcript_18943/g.41016  ORF Transcript_18943/g.41016 Transcript_18943/m.41016 type:complete len:99 (+) Transcript_18943:960-1256(+)
MVNKLFTLRICPLRVPKAKIGQINAAPTSMIHRIEQLVRGKNMGRDPFYNSLSFQFPWCLCNAEFDEGSVIMRSCFLLRHCQFLHRQRLSSRGGRLFC